MVMDMSESGSEMVTAPVFLVGSERSGTTLLRLMLDHHPEIAFQEEFEYAVVQISETREWPPIDEYHAALSTDRVFQWSGFAIDPNLHYPQLVNSFLLQKRQRARKRLVGATVHFHFHKLPWLWPDAKFIHLIRDGRDVSRSVIQFGWAGNMWAASAWWLEAEQLWEQMVKTLSPDQWIDVKYETLIRESVPTLTRICKFLGVSYDERMFEYARTSTYELPDPGLLEQWRRKCSEEEIQLAESRIGDMLTARGYQLSGLPRLEVTSGLQMRLRRQDWLGRVRARLKRYGIGLFVADYLSRHLRLRAWQRRIRLRMNQIEILQLR